MSESFNNIRSSNSEPDSRARNKPKDYFGMYVGMVIQNNDPKKLGRVKVWVPHITNTVYEKKDKLPKDIHFKFLGNNIDSHANPFLEDLKRDLPWAKVCMPLVGTNGSGRYNANLEVGTISDSALVKTITPRPANEDDKAPLNHDNIGEKPARMYEMYEYRVNDSFTKTYRTEQGTASGRGMPNKINRFSTEYLPKSYSNRAKGSFCIPNVGAHVWVSFEGGQPGKPIIFGAVHGNEDWRGIYDSHDNEHGPDYPGAYENRSMNDDLRYDHNTETYRNKYVLNQKGGTFEIVNTDNREIMRMTHYSGSYTEYNNQAKIQLCTGVDTKNVLDDSFLTVQGHRSECSEGDYDLLTRGDHYHKIGNFNINAAKEWKQKFKDELASLKQLFDVKRCSFDKNRNIYFQKTAPGSEREGKPAPCPLCSHPNRQPVWEVNNDPISMILPSVFMSVIGPLGPLASLGASYFASFIEPFGPKASFEYVQPSANPKDYLGDGNCPLCKGTGESPASEGGEWEPQGYPLTDKDGQPVGKQGMIRRRAEDQAGPFANIEKELGLGGSQIIDIFKHKIETIGPIMNDFPAIRIDEAGTAANSEVRVYKKGVATNMETMPVVEQVDVTSLPGGDYTLTCSNKFNCQVGAGGISMKTYGNIDFSGGRINIAGEEINIGTDNNVNIVGKRVTIVAEILALRNKNYKQVLVESNLGVSQNVIIGGGLHVEGELTCQHITGPAQMNVTEGVLGGDLGHGGHTKLGVPVADIVGVAHGIVTSGLGTGGTVEIYDWGTTWVLGNGILNTLAINGHSHNYKTIASHFASSSDEVRNIGKQCNMIDKVGPAPVQNDDTSGPIKELFDKIPLPEIPGLGQSTTDIA